MRVLLLLLIACGDGPGDRTIRGEPTLETFERRMCACSDAACAQTVIRDMTAWTQRIKAPRTTGEDATKIMARYNACLTAVTKR
jgi:hypothetical protein